MRLHTVFLILLLTLAQLLSCIIIRGESFSPAVGSLYTIPPYAYDLSKSPHEYNFPIGTFGNGWLTYDTYGFRRSALYNNWNDSLGGNFGSGPRSPNGTFLAVYMRPSGGNGAVRLLQTHMPSASGATDYPGFTPISSMQSFSAIPIGNYTYEDLDLPCQLALTVFSPLIPWDYTNSSLPISIWNFQVYNPTSITTDVSILFSLENDIGWRIAEDRWNRGGTYEYVRSEDNLIGIVYTYDPLGPSFGRPSPQYLGNMTLATFTALDLQVSYISEWNTYNSSTTVWNRFFSAGELSNSNSTARAAEGSKIWAGALAVKTTLSPGERKNIPFFLATCFPKFNLSNLGSGFGSSPQLIYEHYWISFFQNSWDMALHGSKSYVQWWNKIVEWHTMMVSSGISSNIVMFLLGTLAPIVAGSYWTKEGYFFLQEGMWECIETMDVQIYTDWFFLMFYPELIKNVMKQYCLAQRGDGMIPHSLWNDFTMNRGRSSYHEEPAFVIRAYRTYAWTGDQALLDEMYPHIKKAIEYRNRTDVQSDGLIHNIRETWGPPGSDQSYDVWGAPTMSYLNSQWLLALKLASIMAQLENDLTYSDLYLQAYEKAKENFIEEFWHPINETRGYFKLCLGDVRDKNASMVEQIIGVWYGDLLGVNLLPSEYTKTALATIYERNYDYDHGLGWINGVYEDGAIDLESMFSKQVWTGAQWSLAASLLTQGLYDYAVNVANTTANMEPYEGYGLYCLSEPYSQYITGTTHQNTYTFQTEYWWGRTPYPAYPRAASSWSWYIACSGIIPTPEGLTISPKALWNGGRFVVQALNHTIQLDIENKGDYVTDVTVNGVPHNSLIKDGKAIIPKNLLTEEKIFITVKLTEKEAPSVDGKNFFAPFLGGTIGVILFIAIAFVFLYKRRRQKTTKGLQ